MSEISPNLEVLLILYEKMSPYSLCQLFPADTLYYIIITYPNFGWGHRVVRIRAQEFHRQRMALPELGGEQHGCDRQQLQLLPRDSTLSQEPVHVAHCEGKHLLLALLFLAHLEKLRF